MIDKLINPRFKDRKDMSNSRKFISKHAKSVFIFKRDLKSFTQITSNQNL